MKLSIGAILLLWQLGSAATPSPSRHLRYQREIHLPADVSGQVCVVLDGVVFAHTASTGAGDIRIYGRDGDRQFEVPFAMTESGPSVAEPQVATPGNVVVRNGELAFDLAMPASNYTEVDLNLNAKDFVGSAQVTGVDTQGRAIPLGTFPIFDLSAQHLARSTVLSLPTSSYPVLHVALRLMSADGGEPMPMMPSIITGATVPPSREEESLYTTIASTSAIQEQGKWSIATMAVPAHVPIERARFVLSPQYHENFLRDATIAAAPMETGLAALGAAEGVSGHIFRVTRAALAGVPAIDSHAMTINTVIGANLRAPAKVTASVDNGTSSPLPITRVDLQMRERRLCFEASPGASYMLRYGDAELPAPSYGYARHFVANPTAATALLGPEEKNPRYVQAGTDEVHRRPGRELPWLLLIAGISAAGVTALQYVRHKREGMK